MDSVNHPLPSHLVCPVLRTYYLKSQHRAEIGGQAYFIVDNSYYFPNDKDEEESSYPHHLLPLLGCNNKENIPNAQVSICVGKAGCGACWKILIGTTYYFCEECDNWYHKECVESLPILKSPYHPKHYLQLYISDDSLSSTRLHCRSCSSGYGGFIYHCSICDFDVDPVCATKPSYITFKKRHEHTLYYFPRKSVLICDICALNDDESLFFACLLCDFFVHKRCIYLPDVIKISRHKHGLSFAPSLLSHNWSCGICRKKIDANYGAYSCMKKGCNFVVHSRCATRPNVWDGKEFEGEAEESNESIKSSFEKISDGIILHFSHPEHPMQLEEDVKIWFDEKKYCQACILPLNDGKAYTCIHMKCYYILHEECAYLPRVIQHALHAHLLTLESFCAQTRHTCLCCGHWSFGFKYVCYNTYCDHFCLDVRCASISEPYDYHSHCHPLFLTYPTGPCSICHGYSVEYLTCEECQFVLCFRCATRPYKVRYKNDEHPLAFSYEKYANGVYWCDLCEETLDPRTGFYKCYECEVTLHIRCLLGDDEYMNPGSKLIQAGEELNIIQNNTLTRPICKGCQERCKYKMMLIGSSGNIYCSIFCKFYYGP